ncbi:hypothetical protein D3C72_1835840 [compost metagenome]
MPRDSSIRSPLAADPEALKSVTESTALGAESKTKVSLSAPPVSRSAPVPPTMRSSPARPLITSLPPPPRNWSFDAEPVIVSPKAAPMTPSKFL